MTATRLNPTLSTKIITVIGSFVSLSQNGYGDSKATIPEESGYVFVSLVGVYVGSPANVVLSSYGVEDPNNPSEVKARMRKVTSGSGNYNAAFVLLYAKTV